jgi:L-idonate 5-dehydrogenase
MKACVIHGKHQLSIEEREIPIPGEQEVLVRFGAGGICGSDLHYYNSGRVGAFVLREAMTLGHEVSGEVFAVGSGVTQVAVGDRVAVHPARTCGICRECRSGRANLCSNVLFYGSAARFPHVQGAFAEYVLADQSQCISIGAELSFVKAACAEPLAVALHAARRAGDLLGKNVLITGAGPIGLLILMVVRSAGAVEIAITDLLDEPLQVARQLGAQKAFNMSQVEGKGAEIAALQNHFDVAIEASGTLSALSLCIGAVVPGGRIVQLGLLPPQCDDRLHLAGLVSREIELVGSFRFYTEFVSAVRLLCAGRIDPSPLLTAQIPLAEAERAFQLASDRKQALKVSLVQ